LEKRRASLKNEFILAKERLQNRTDDDTDYQDTDDTKEV